MENENVNTKIDHDRGGNSNTRIDQILSRGEKLTLLFVYTYTRIGT